MIVLKSTQEIELMRAGQRDRGGGAWRSCACRVRPGISTAELDRVAERDDAQAQGAPGLQGLRGGGPGVPADAVHLDQRRDRPRHPVAQSASCSEGDIVGLDFGVCYEGYYGDAAMTVAVGQIGDRGRAAHAGNHARRCGRASSKVAVGKRIGDVSAAIQERVEARGFSVVREFVGHGIGRQPARGAAGAELREARIAVCACGRGWCWRSSRW